MSKTTNDTPKAIEQFKNLTLDERRAVYENYRTILNEKLRDDMDFLDGFKAKNDIIPSLINNNPDIEYKLYKTNTKGQTALDQAEKTLDNFAIRMTIKAFGGNNADINKLRTNASVLFDKLGIKGINLGEQNEKINFIPDDINILLNSTQITEVGDKLLKKLLKNESFKEALKAKLAEKTTEINKPTESVNTQALDSSHPKGTQKIYTAEDPANTPSPKNAIETTTTTQESIKEIESQKPKKRRSFWKKIKIGFRNFGRIFTETLNPWKKSLEKNANNEIALIKKAMNEYKDEEDAPPGQNVTETLGHSKKANQEDSKNAEAKIDAVPTEPLAPDAPTEKENSQQVLNLNKEAPTGPMVAAALTYLKTTKNAGDEIVSNQGSTVSSKNTKERDRSWRRPLI
ncbi:MAG: hypothetical protein KA998_03930 [Rickettsiaceae bacterium]|nr:hypothetical protein [Rickettsiaceae bacterium]